MLFGFSHFQKIFRSSSCIQRLKALMSWFQEINIKLFYNFQCDFHYLSMLKPLQICCQSKKFQFYTRKFYICSSARHLLQPLIWENWLQIWNLLLTEFLVLKKFTIKVEKREVSLTRFLHYPRYHCSHAQQSQKIFLVYQIKKSKHIVESLGFNGYICPCVQLVWITSKGSFLNL